MKSRVKYLLLIALLFILGCKNVGALTLTYKYKANADGLRFNIENSSNQDYRANTFKISETSKQVYCVSPSATTANSVYKDGTVITSNDFAPLNSIISNSEKTCKEYGLSSTGEECSQATELALRVQYVPNSGQDGDEIYPFYSCDNSNQKKLCNQKKGAFIKLANAWNKYIDDGVLAEKLDTKNTDNGIYWNGTQGDGEAIMKTAYALYSSSKKDKDLYKTSGKNSIKATSRKGDNKYVNTDDEGNPISERTIKYVYADFNLNNFTAEDSYFIYNGFSSNVDAKNYEHIEVVGYQVNSGSIQSLSNGQDIKPSGGSGKITIIFKIWLDYKEYESSGDDLDTINLKINYKYKAENAKGVIYKPINEGEQWYLGRETDEAEDSFEIKDISIPVICDPEDGIPRVCSDTTDGTASFFEGKDKKGAVNVKMCIVGSSDKKGNTYAKIDSNENPYCSVYCKEDYDMQLPGKKTVESGTYFKISVSVKGTQSCYTSKLDKELLDNNINEIITKGVLESSTSINTDIQNEINKYNSCAEVAGTSADTWYNYDPTLTYWYEDSGWSSDCPENGEAEGKFAGKSTKGDLNTYYCSGDVDGAYDTCSTGWKTSVDDVKNTVTYNGQNYTINDFSYAKQTQSVTAMYDSKTQYAIKRNDGSIIDVEDASEDDNIVQGLPVSLKNSGETKYYKIFINNLGTYYSDNTLGRIYGPKGLSSLRAQVEGVSSCDNAYACTYGMSSPTPTNATICYKNGDSCSVYWDSNGNGIYDASDAKKSDYDDCVTASKHADIDQNCNKGSGGNTICIKENNKCIVKYSDGTVKKEFDDCSEAITYADDKGNCCPDCKVMCINTCMIDNDKDNKISNNYVFRTITNASINPNSDLEREVGFNWNKENPTNELVAAKAENTLGELYPQSSTNPEVDNPSTDLNLAETTVSNKYNFKFKLTPAITSYIRSYNSEKQKEGSYNNKTLYCDSYALEDYKDKKACENDGYSWVDDKCVLQNIFCYSDFIDELVAKYPNEIKIDNRPSETQRNEFEKNTYSLTNDKGIKNIISNGYFTAFVYDSVDIDSDKIADIGPSWK